MAEASLVDSRVTKVLTDLTAIPLESHSNFVFEDQEVFIDGRRFVNCAFHRCRLVLLLGLFEFVGKADFVDCSWGWGGPAQRAIDLVEDIRSNERQGPIQ